MNIEKGLEKIQANGRVLAFVVRNGYGKPGYNFISPLEFPLQLGISIRKKNDHVKPHAHVPFKELKNIPAQEFIYIKSGRLEITLFHNKNKHRTITLEEGDMILLNCGHELKFLKDTKIIEIKQGPYRGKDVEKEYY